MKDARQIAMNVTGGLLVVATVGMLVYLCWGLLHREMPITNKDALMLLIGVILAKYSDIISFYFGSSSGNKRQTETIDKLAETASVAQAALTPNAKPAVTLGPGESATVAAENDNGSKGRV